MEQKQKKQKKLPVKGEEVDDLHNRLQDVELELVEAKEFSHLSSEAMIILQEQVNDLQEFIKDITVEGGDKKESSKLTYT